MVSACIQIFNIQTLDIYSIIKLNTSINFLSPRQAKKGRGGIPPPTPPSRRAERVTPSGARRFLSQGSAGSEFELFRKDTTKDN